MVLKKWKRSVSLLIAFLFIWTSLGTGFASPLLGGYEESVLVDEPVASGIRYMEKALLSGDGSVQRLNIVSGWGRFYIFHKIGWTTERSGAFSNLLNLRYTRNRLCFLFLPDD